MTLDTLVVTDAVRGMDPGQPAPVVMKCRHGHSARLDKAPPVGPPAVFRYTPQCAVCGVEIPRQVGSAMRKSCSREHKIFIEVKRAEAQAAHVRRYKPQRKGTPFVPFRFIIEAQPWYRGAATAFQPPAPPAELVVPAGPDFPAIPAAWLDGFRRLYPTLEGAAAPLAIFPALEDTDEEVTPQWFTPRRYRRRKPRPEPTPEQLMPYPVPHS